jgi:hypothetical protein
MNGVLVPPKNLCVAIKNIHALVGTTAHGKDISEHLQEAGVSTRGGGTTAVGRATRGCIRRRRGVAMDGNLGKSRMNGLMCNILVEPLMSHHLDHAHDERSKST